MERKRPISGSFYRHFQGNIYQIRELCRLAGTGEDMVVYQGMYPPFEIWVCPLGEFLAQIDRRQYPDTKQQFRFEEIRFTAAPPQGNGVRQEQQSPSSRTLSPSDRQEQQKSTASRTPSPLNRQEVSDDELRNALINGQEKQRLVEKLPEEEIARRGFLALLDAEDFREKRQILVGLQPYLNGLYLSNIAVALDIVLEDGSDKQHFDTILHCLETFERYEGGRLRS